MLDTMNFRGGYRTNGELDHAFVGTFPQPLQILMSSRDIKAELPQAWDDATLAIEERDATFPAHLEKYRQYIQHLDLSEAQQRELLEALWLIMNQFVERSFNPPHSAVNTPPVASSIAKSRN